LIHRANAARPTGTTSPSGNVAPEPAGSAGANASAVRRSGGPCRPAGPGGCRTPPVPRPRPPLAGGSAGPARSGPPARAGARRGPPPASSRWPTATTRSAAHRVGPGSL
jgi:hypothetical protein